MDDKDYRLSAADMSIMQQQGPQESQELKIISSLKRPVVLSITDCFYEFCNAVLLVDA
jgi:hypothetical protein